MGRGGSRGEGKVVTQDRERWLATREGTMATKVVATEGTVAVEEREPWREVALERGKSRHRTVAVEERVDRRVA